MVLLKDPAVPLVDIQETMVELRWHGRGGQGVVTAGELLAAAAMLEDRYFQSFPEFGAERSGAPVTAYTRISDSPIDVQSAIDQPGVVLVLDSTLLGAVNVFSGLPRRTGTLVVNTPFSAKRLQNDSFMLHWTVCTVDASAIAMDLLGKDLPNVPMLGALLKAKPILSVESVASTIKTRMSGFLNHAKVEANLAALRRGYAEATWTPPRAVA
jgi:pyruvate ferredoxin oxidoreductase gamma subunit